MAWKKKEKPLTPEEIIALAKQELAPYWFGRDPALAAVQAGDRVTAHPLDPEFSKKPWILLFFDYTALSSQATLQIGRELHARYASYGFEILGVLNSDFPSLNRPETIQLLRESCSSPYAWMIDEGSLMARAFGVSSFPKLVVVHGGRTIFESERSLFNPSLEEFARNFLWVTDCGLAFPLPLEERSFKQIRDLGQINLGAGKWIAAELELKGSLHQDRDRIVVGDPQASISFSTPLPVFALIAQALKPEEPPSVVMIEVDGAPLPESGVLESVKWKDDGRSFVQVHRLPLYRIHRDIKPNSRVRLLFPEAKDRPVVVYGL